MRAKDGVGRYGERVAAQRLTDAGMVVLERNWRCSLGEIDIVARDGSCLVVCEVKTRRGEGTGTPAEAVTPAKLQRLRRLAAQWLAEHDVHPADVRLDVVAVLVAERGPARVEHLRGGVLMALARALAVGLVGLDGHVVEVEADISPGLPAFVLVGLPDASLHEAKDRVRAATANSGFPLPARRITVNLSPATLPKSGSAFDLSTQAV